EGCSKLATMLEEGLGVTADAARAETLHQKACDAGVGWSCRRLGLMVQSSDPSRAGTLFQKSCAHHMAAPGCDSGGAPSEPEPAAPAGVSAAGVSVVVGG